MSTQQQAANPSPDKTILKRLPPLPGVYRFIGEKDTVLYVGKAGNLRKRVSSYFNPARLSPRIRLMIAAMRDVEITVTASEHAALLLENNLIKTLRPRYNILFRDDKSYPFLRLSGHAYPRLMFYRSDKTANKSDDLFGPFPDSNAIRKTVNMLQRIFHLRTCADSVFINRARPCLLHGIGRCSAPCVNFVTPAQYADDVRGAKQLLAGDSHGVEADLQQKMEAAAAELNFETAAVLRNRLRALAVVRAKHFVDVPGEKDADYVGVYCHQKSACVNLVSVRNGQRMGERRLFSECANATAHEVLAAFIGQHYGDMQQPPQIFANHLPDPAPLPPLGVSAPSGEQKRRTDEADNNARIALELRLAQTLKAADKLAALGDYLNMPPPSRIECFDISHSSGEEPMAARVVFTDGEAQTAQYRRFAITPELGGKDTAAITEAVGRCYRRAVAESSPLPNLILIDGGITQLHAAQVAIPSVAKHIPIIAIAKGAARKAGEETLLNSDGKIIHIPPTNAAFHLLQAVRDEAHRFAVAGHRHRRDKKRHTSSLENIEGVGPKRRRQLITYFGGLRELKAAGEEELIKIRGVSPSLAKRIYNFLHE